MRSASTTARAAVPAAGEDVLRRAFAPRGAVRVVDETAARRALFANETGSVRTRARGVADVDAGRRERRAGEGRGSLRKPRANRLDAVSGRHESGPSASTVARDATRCAAIGTYLVEASARARARGVGVGAPAGITNRGRRLLANVRVPPRRAATVRLLARATRTDDVSTRHAVRVLAVGVVRGSTIGTRTSGPSRVAAHVAPGGPRGDSSSSRADASSSRGDDPLRGSHRARAFRVRVPGSIRPGGFSPRRLTGDGRPGRLTLGAIPRRLQKFSRLIRQRIADATRRRRFELRRRARIRVFDALCEVDRVATRLRVRVFRDERVESRDDAAFAKERESTLVRGVSVPARVNLLRGEKLPHRAEKIERGDANRRAVLIVQALRHPGDALLREEGGDPRRLGVGGSPPGGEVDGISRRAFARERVERIAAEVRTRGHLHRGVDDILKPTGDEGVDVLERLDASPRVRARLEKLEDAFGDGGHLVLRRRHLQFLVRGASNERRRVRGAQHEPLEEPRRVQEMIHGTGFSNPGVFVVGIVVAEMSAARPRTPRDG